MGLGNAENQQAIHLHGSGYQSPPDDDLDANRRALNRDATGSLGIGLT